VGKVKTFRRKAREFDVNLGRGVRDKREVTDRTERIVVDRTESRHHDVGASVAYALVQPRLQIESRESLASQVAGKVTGSDEHDSFIFHDQGSLFGRSKLEASFGPLAMRAGPICTVRAAAFASARIGRLGTHPTIDNRPHKVRGLATFEHDSRAKVKQNTTMMGRISSTDVVAGCARGSFRAAIMAAETHHPIRRTPAPVTRWVWL